MITKQELHTVLTKAKTLKAMVVGDVMLDKYIYGKVDRISPEALVPVLTLEKTEVKAGGSANVALNLASWGCKTTLAGITGHDSNADILQSLLSHQSIDFKCIHCENRPTTVKTRVVAASHQLLRIDEESSTYLEGEEEQKTINQIMDFIAQETPDLVILQDYNKGLLTENLITILTQYCRNHNIFLAVDPKEINFSNFHNADLFKPNLREAGMAAHKDLHPEDLSEFSALWRKEMNLGTIAITLSSNGIFLKNEQDECHVSPDRTVDVVDVCGAGDAVICSLALGLMSGLSLEKSGFLANLTGAYVCSHSGVVAVNPLEIESWL